MLPTTELEWVNHLARRHDGAIPGMRELNDLYEGVAPLHYIHPEILREVGDRIQAVSLGWPMLAVDPLEERLDHLGFRYPDGDDADNDPDGSDSHAGDENLQRVWEENDLFGESQLGHIDALVMGRSYICVGAGDDTDTPLVTVESPLEVYADIDPRTREPRAALRRWLEHQDSLVRAPEQFATLYLPDATVWYEGGSGGWQETDRDEHGLGAVPVTPLVNRSRLSDRMGKSELTKPLLSLSHAANKIASDMMVAAEFHAIPLRALFGISAGDLTDDKGNVQSPLQLIMGRLLTMEGADGNGVVPHEFSASSLANFHDTLTQLAKHATSLIGLPPTAFGVVTDTPASAEAWRAAEARLIKRAERRQAAFNNPYKRTGRLIRRFQDGDWDPAAKRLKPIWRDPATPTRAQTADAVRKLFGDGPIITKRQAREDIGYTPGQIRRMEAEDKALSEADPLAQIARDVSGAVAGMPAPVTDDDA